MAGIGNTKALNMYVVGCGGIGGYLLQLLPQSMACLTLDAIELRYGTPVVEEILEAEGLSTKLNRLNFFRSLTLIDGDTFSGHNALRQEAVSGSKLATQMNVVRNKDAWTTWLFNTELIGYNVYVTPANIGKIFKDPSGGIDIVFLCVDNHKTRYEISKWLEYNRDDVLIINGGNNKTTGNVTVFERRYGVNLDPPIYKLYPEINPNTDKRPDEVDCGAVHLQNDQTAITNNIIASIMLAMFDKWYRTGGFDQKLRQKDENGNNKVVRRNEVIVDTVNMSMTSLTHSKDVDNRPTSQVEGELPEDAEII